MPAGRTVSAVSWAEFPSRTGRTGSRMGCRRKPGGSTGFRRAESCDGHTQEGWRVGPLEIGGEENGNPRNCRYFWRSTECCCGPQRLLTPAGHRHHAVLYVGVPDEPERHSCAPLEVYI